MQQNYNKDEEVKSSILKAAKNVFQKWGFEKATMEDIANEAGKGKSTLYYYYKSKDEIFELLVLHELRNIINKAKSLVEKEKSVKEKLRKYLAAVLIEIKTAASISSILRGDIRKNKSMIEKLSKQMNTIEEGVIADILREGINSGEFSFLSETEIDKAANVVTGIIRGLELYLFLDVDDPEKIDLATRIITEGL
jgi:AcrR family transcriptional regulator